MRRLLTLTALAVVTLFARTPVEAQSTAACVAAGRAYVDSIANLFIPEETLRQYQTRNYTRLDSLITARCAAPTVRIDTVTVVRTQVDTVFHFDTVVVTSTPDTVTPPSTQRPVAVVTYDCAVRPNGNFRCRFDGRASSGPNAITSYRWTTPTEAVAQTGDTAVFGFTSTMTTAVVTLQVEDVFGLTGVNETTVVFDTSAPPPPPPTPTPTPPPAPLPPPHGVELPRVSPVVPAGLETVNCTAQVTTNLQGALNGAQSGDVLCLSGTFVGNFTLPAKAGWVVVRSAASVAAPGVRVRPSLAAPLATIRGVGVSPTIQTASGASGWYLRELNIAAESTTTTVYSVVNLAKGSSDIVLDRVWVHPPEDRQNQRCVVANAAAVTIINSWLGECHGKGFDSQAIITWDSPGPFKIVNNTLQSVGENYMAGGADPTTPGLRPCDIEFRGNHVWTPLSWGPPGVKPTKWTKKNLLELKNACRMLIENNVFDGSWGDAQTGYAIALKSSNQGGKCPWCGTSDVTVRRNLIINSAAPFTMSGTVPGTNPVDSATRRVLVEENYAETGGPLVTTEARQLMFTGKATDLTLRRNTWDRLTLNVGTLYTGSDAGATTSVNMVLDHDLVHFGQYGVMGQWSPTTSPPGTINLTVLGLGTYGAKARVGQIPNMTVVPSLAAGIAAGFGVARSVVEAATAGVVVLP